MNQNQMMGQLLLQMAMTRAKDEGDSPVLTVEEWYAQQPYEKIDPNVYFLSVYIDDDGRYRVGFYSQGPEDVELITTIKLYAKRKEECDKLIAVVARNFPCLAVQTADGFDYPFFSEITYNALAKAQARRDRRAAKLEQNAKTWR